MSVQGVGPVGPQQLDTGRQRIEGVAEADGSFGDVLKDALGEVSQLQDNARDAIGAFLRGEPVELHEVMAATEEAGIALELLIEIRNKLTEAYRSVINMQG
jgi:flagellar hook-basal body complex protein FliE